MSVKRMESKEEPAITTNTFVSVESSPELIAVRESSLQPGSLVHGVTIAIEQIEAELQQGLLRCSVTKARRFTHTFLAYALLSKKPLPERYKQADHHGPITETKSQSQYGINFAVVCSREKLLAEFPGQLAAVGPYFWNDYFASVASEQYESPESENGTKKVYEIPVGIPTGDVLLVHRADAWDDPYGEEVDLYIRKGEEGLIVPQSCWSAIIISEKNWPVLAKQVHLLPPVPIFNTNCDKINLLLTTR